MTPRALEGIRILDLSRVLAGPYCAMILADYGAEVIKVEQPGSGDPTREWGPPWVGRTSDHDGLSAYFLTANRNKRSLTLNLKSAEGQTIARQLTAQADVVVENFMPGTLTGMGLSYEALSAHQPGLILCSISGFGQDGTYRDRPGYDFMIQAEGGLMSITGPTDGKPSKVGVAIVDITAALYATTAILAALHHRTQTGRGQHIDVALLDTQVGWLANVAQNYLATGLPPERYGNAHANIVPYETFPTADGEIAVGMGTDDQFRRFCAMVERDDLRADPRYQTNAGRVASRTDLIAELRAVFANRTSADWLAALNDLRIPAAPINDIPTILNDPHVRSRKMVQTAEHPVLGPIDVLGPVAKLSETPATVRTAPPMLGEQTDEILRELGYSVEAVAELRHNKVI